MQPNAATLRDRARQLRRDQTDAEKRLWACLRSRQLDDFKFRRQFVIGPFIADFCCFEQRLVVELDGGQHAERSDADRRRADFLQSRGYRVLRFWNNELIENTDAVLEQIAGSLAGPNTEPSPLPSPKGRG